MKTKYIVNSKQSLVLEQRGDVTSLSLVHHSGDKQEIMIELLPHHVDDLVQILDTCRKSRDRRRS